VAGGYVRLGVEQTDAIWSRLQRGMAAKPVARELGLSEGTVRAYLVRCGGIRPVPRRRRVGRLVLREREEISRGLAAGMSLRAIAVQLGRAPSTISREVAGNGGGAGTGRCGLIGRRGHGRRGRSGASSRCSLGCVTSWRTSCAGGGRRSRSAAGWRVPIRARRRCRSRTRASIARCMCRPAGALRRELTQCLRTGRVLRRPKGVRLPDGRGGRPNTLHISERPAEAEDRAVPGHWEGDRATRGRTSGVNAPTGGSLVRV
jgi:DNA-binding CsgD family transcriptional regulator